MTLSLFRHLWGVTDPWETVFPKIKEKGYNGIECPLPEDSARERFRALLQQYSFRYIAQIFTEGKTLAEHLTSYRRQLEGALAFEPVLVNCHGGRDSFSEMEAEAFIGEALEFERSLGVRVAHETHRGRILYNPWVTDRLLAKFGDLKLCCDYSHWVCVCERLLDDVPEILQRCARHAIHIHARVGYEEGPQVPDPRAPEYRRHLEAHEGWWRMVWEAQKQRGVKESTLTPEFGPPDYMHTLPYTSAPVADLWQICDWQAGRQMDNFAGMT